MEVQIIIHLKTNAPSVDKVSSAIHSAVDRLIDNANFMSKTTDNGIISFQAMQVRQDSLIKKEFQFPNDLDKVQPVTENK